MENGTQYDPEMEEFLQNEGRSLTVIPPRERKELKDPAKLGEIYDLNIFGEENRENIEEIISMIIEWLNGPIIFDKFGSHNERRKWESEIDEKYLKRSRSVSDFLNSNKITISSISSVTSLISTLFSYDPEHRVLKEQKKRELKHEIDVFFSELKDIYEIADTVFKIKEKTNSLLGIEMQPDNEELRESIRTRTVDLMHELEAIICEVLEKFKRRG